MTFISHHRVVGEVSEQAVKDTFTELLTSELHSRTEQQWYKNEEEYIDDKCIISVIVLL